MRIRKMRAGFTLVEIMIVVALVGLLATIAAPTWVHARTHSQTQACVNNLKQIDGAKQQWALENKAGQDATPAFADISGYLKHSVLCPADAAETFATSYTLNTVSERPVCQIAPADHVLPEVTN